MAKLEKTITIHAPVESVFAYVTTDPANLLEIWPSMVEYTAVKETPDHVGDRFRWVYKMAGMRFEGESETTEFVANQRVVSQSKTGIPSTFVWTYQPEEGHTKVTLEVEYTVPVPLLGKLAESFIIKLNEREAETLLANLKARMET